MRKAPWIKRAAATFVLVVLMVGTASACTTVIVGKKATADGSVMVAQTVDGWYDQRLVVVPGGKHASGTMMPIYKNICIQTRGGIELLKVGEIPQAEETYTYFHAGYPFMNEHQLLIGEHTWVGREENECQAGWMLIEQLQILALQRTKTAREAVKLMGEMAEKYGYGDSGESLTVIDKNEGWVFEITGPGLLWTAESGKPGAIWAAQRVPDDGVYVAANRARIAELNLEDTENFMASSNVKSFAAEMCWWKEGEKFIFHAIYNPGGDTTVGSQIREWGFFNFLKTEPALSDKDLIYPVFGKATQKISIPMLMDGYRNLYYGTADDMTKGLAAGPFSSPARGVTPKDLRPEGAKDKNWTRAIPVDRCSYSFIGQARDWLPDSVGGVAWFGEDVPYSTVYMPIFAGTTTVPKPFSVGDRTKFDRESAYWAFNFASNYANLRFDGMIEDIKAEQAMYERRFLEELPEIEKRAAELYKSDPGKAAVLMTNWVNKNMNDVYAGWWNFAFSLPGKYYDGYRIDENGKAVTLGYPTWWLEAVGFGNDDAEPKK
jgi:dipeptidase